jgi:tellurite resistance protein
MELRLDPAVVHLGLRAVKTIAMADRSVDTRERAMLEAAFAALVSTGADAGTFDLEALEPIRAQDLAAAIPNELTRTRILQAQFIMAIIDGDVSKPEMALLEEFASALGVDEPRMKNMHQLVGHHHRLLKLDLNRHSKMVSEAVRHAYQKRGLRGAWKTVAPFLGRSFAHDEDLAWRYRRLGLLPEDTFGRAYWVHMRERGFARFQESPADSRKSSSSTTAVTCSAATGPILRASARSWHSSAAS